MAVTVNFKDKPGKTTAAEPNKPAPPELSDYAAPGTRSGGMIALLLWLVLIGVLCGTLYFFPGADNATQPFGIGCFAWWLLSTVGYFVAAPWFVMRRLRMGDTNTQITAKNNPTLKRLFLQTSALVGVGEPEVFLLPEGVSQIRCMGNKNRLTVMITKATVDLMQPHELVALVVRNLMHARQGHTRRIMLLQFLNDTPAIVRMLVWPVGLYAALLRFFWLENAEQTADRLTLLLVKNHKILVGAILKQQVATDPVMQNQKITPQDVDNFIQQDNVIGVHGTEILIQYKLGTAIQDNHALGARIKEINEWADSTEFHEALQKLFAASQKGTSAAAAPAAPGA